MRNLLRFPSPITMAAPLSLDLRRRIVDAARSLSQRAVAERFAVSIPTVQRLVARERRGQSLKPTEPERHGPAPRVDADGEALFAAWLAENPSLTQAELARRFSAETARPISRITAGRALARMGYTRKKKP
jgi:transposase